MSIVRQHIKLILFLKTGHIKQEMKKITNVKVKMATNNRQCMLGTRQYYIQSVKIQEMTVIDPCGF